MAREGFGVKGEAKGGILRGWEWRGALAAGRGGEGDTEGQSQRKSHGGR
jgi:hypothetical protein